MNFAQPYAGPAGRPDGDWTPAVDIIEHPDRFDVLADLPGVAPDAIEISLDGNMLSVSGERPASQPGSRQHLGERQAGRFYRSFTLPVSVDGDAIAAHTTQGVLQLRIPKKPEVQPRRVDVAVEY